MAFYERQGQQNSQWGQQQQQPSSAHDGYHGQSSWRDSGNRAPPPGGDVGAPPYRHPPAPDAAQAASAEKSRRDSRERARREQEKSWEKQYHKERRAQSHPEKRPSSSDSKDPRPRRHTSRLASLPRKASIDELLNKDSKFVCSSRFLNNLPEVPLDPKCLKYPFDATRHVQYDYASSLEPSYKHELLTEMDLGIPVDLIDPGAYPIAEGTGHLDPADLALLDNDEDSLKGGNAIGDRQQMAQATRNKIRSNVTWLRKPEYLSNDLYDPVQKFQTDLGSTNKMVYSASKEIVSLKSAGPKSLQQQVEDIEETFLSAKENHTLKHPHNQSATITEIIPVYPDLERWANQYCQLVFDMDPSAAGRGDSGSSRSQADYALVKGIQHPTDKDNNHVVYMVPEEGSEGVGTEEVEYRWLREYKFDMRTMKDNYFLLLSEDGAYYNEMPNLIKLNKRKGTGDHIEDFVKPSKITVSYRILEEKEEEERSERLKQLMGPEKGPMLITDAAQPSSSKVAAEGEEAPQAANEDSD